MTEGNEEERLLEHQLDFQLQEQRDSLSAVNEALSSDPSNPELLSIREELGQAIKDAEEGLLNLKRARLLREADSVLHGYNCGSEEVKMEPIVDRNDGEAEVVEEGIGFSVGWKCRFRCSDGRWYSGQIVGFEGSDLARVCFLTPTSENMMMCKFFLQQRCRFGTNCRLSHGLVLPCSSLKKYIPTILDQSLIGSSIWARSDNKAGIWREAELESWNDELREGQVVFRDDGSSAKLGTEAITLSEFAQASNEEESDSSFEECDSSDYDEESGQGLGFVESSALQRGIQKETAIFAKWENHTRGIASKMMANMGYSEGMGLGVSGQGMLNPISVKVLKPKQSLDHAFESHESNDNGGKQGNKKRSRGGKRKREKKFATAARAEKDEEESRPDVFSLINNQLAMHSEAMNGRSVKREQNKGSETKKVDRRALIAYDEEMKDLRLRIEKLEEMASRNRNEKPVYDAAMRKLNDTRKALEEIEAIRSSASNAVTHKEKEKRWLKF